MEQTPFADSTPDAVDFFSSDRPEVDLLGDTPRLELGDFPHPAWRFLPEVVRQIVPANTPGVYALFVDRRPVYVGRSDRCLRSRLVRHNHAALASHFSWRAARSAWQAFALESAWFHWMVEHGQGLNAIHPAKPVGSHGVCPFCDPRLDTALNLALAADRVSPELKETP